MQDPLHATWKVFVYEVRRCETIKDLANRAEYLIRHLRSEVLSIAQQSVFQARVKSCCSLAELCGIVHVLNSKIDFVEAKKLVGPTKRIIDGVEIEDAVLKKVAGKW